jgi:hypothetical protein
MTTTSGDPLLGNRLATSFLRIHPLAALLLLAAAIRLPLAFWPNVIHADEIYQSLDPAWRILGHDGIITWEWRYGIRSWFLPSLLAGPVGLGDWIAPGGTGAFIAPRLAAALASLSIVASAWVFGARISRTHAIIAAFVAAIWFEFVSFAPHTLSEPLATAIILPAAALLTRTSLCRDISPSAVACSLSLSSFAFNMPRPSRCLHWAPAGGVGATWFRWSAAA